MQLFYLTCLLTFSISMSLSGQTPKTEISIIGTIHSGNRHFNHKTLYKIFRKYKPDLILWEQGFPFRRQFGMMTAYHLKVAKPSIEQMALHKYSKKNKSIKILPYDTIFGPRKKYVLERQRIRTAYFDSLAVEKMSYSDSLVFADYTNRYNKFYDYSLDTSLNGINSADVVAMARNLFLLEEKYLVGLGKKYIADSSLCRQFEEELNFWFARNNYMANKINHYAKGFAGKRIFVLAGLNHKYFLLDRLAEMTDPSIKLLELDLE